jgi:nucleoside-diphosphate-sugar epimerase
MIVTIFGGSGEIGSSLANKFKNAGHKVYSITSDRDKLNKDYLYWDYCSNKILKILSKTDVVIISINPVNRKSNFINEGYTNINLFLKSIYNIIYYINLSKQKNKIKLIFLSSAVVYPQCNNYISNTVFDINKIPAQPFEQIGIALRLAENFITNKLSTKYNVSVLRLSTIYGQLPDLDLFSGIIKDLFTKILINNDSSILIDCNQNLRRNFLHISDLFNLILHDILKSTNYCEIKNISSNINTSMFELSKMITKNLNKNIQISFNNEKFANSRLIKPDSSFENYKFIELDHGINSIVNSQVNI